jgi:hypothetical protein
VSVTRRGDSTDVEAIEVDATSVELGHAEEGKHEGTLATVFVLAGKEESGNGLKRTFHFGHR